MKKTIVILIAVSLVFSSCFATPEPTQSTEPRPTTIPTTAPQVETTQEATLPLSDYQTPMVSFSSPTVTENYGGGSLVYTFQTMELLLEDPQVSEWVTLELLNHTDFDSTEGPRLLAEAEQTGETIGLTLLHTPARLDRSLLSLVSTQVISGTGPKATGVMASSTFDLITGRQLSLKDVLVSQYDAKTLCDRIIAALEPLAQEGVLYSDYTYVISDLFASNAPVENWYLSQNGLCVYFAPYEIAPYNLGTVTAEISYDTLLGLLREEYFPGEVLGLVGNLKCSQGLDGLKEQSQFRDMVLDRDGQEWVITACGAVEDLRIESGMIQDEQFVTEATLFAAATLCRGDAIVLQASQETLATLYVTYRSGGETVFLPLSDFLAS